MFTERLRIGAAVDVRAEATIYPDPTVPIFTYNAGFEGMAVGSTPPSSVTGGTVRVSTEQHRTGANSARLDPTGAQMLTVVFPPAPFGNDSAWDAVPRARAGQTWRFGMSVWLSRAVLVRIRPVGFTRPDPSTAFRIDGFDLIPDLSATGWQTLAGTVVPPDAVWLGVAIDVVAPRWDDMPYDQTWDGMPAGVRWDDIGLAFVDDLVLLAPAAGALRRSTVFAGRITDLSSSYDLDAGGQIVDVVAQTHLAELNNRYVGDQPWALESLSSRFARIVAASGQALDYQIDSSVQGKPVTWRDVDNAPSGDLLHQLAQSVAGALWSASSDVGRPYLWLEDINQRPAQFVLSKVGGVVVIIPGSGGNPARLVVIDACDVLLEPVTWTQTTEDNATRVVVTWQDQTVDNEGNQDPTSRDLTVTNPTMEATTGRRRIQITTQLAVQLDAQLTAESVLARVSTPGWRLSGVTWEMATTDRLDAATLDVVMKLLDGVTKLGIGIRLTGLPEWSPAGDADVNLYLEGGNYKNIDGAWVLELLTSSAISQGKSSVRWDDLPGSTSPAAVRTNRAQNPRAISTGATGWTTGRGFGTGGAGAYSYLTATSGPSADVFTARRKTWTTASTATADSGFIVNSTATTFQAVTPGQVWTVSVYVRHSSATAKVFRNRLIWHATTAVGSGNVGAVVEGADVTVAGGLGWTRVTVTGTVPAGALGMELICDVMTSPAGPWAVGNTADATACLMELAAAPPGTYFDGSTPDAAPLDYAWAGTVNASNSTRTDTTPVTTGWRWDDWSPTMTWNDLHGVGI
jgi:hypothetical protein